MNRKTIVILIVVFIATTGIYYHFISKTRGLEADLVFATGAAHKFLDPQRMSWMHDIRIARCLFEPLTAIDPETLGVEPGAAKAWEVSDDGLTYTFHLRAAGRWSSEHPLLAEHFVYAWRRGLLPDLAADYTELFFCIDGAKDFFDWRADRLRAFADGKLDISAEELWEQTKQRFDDTVAVQALDDLTLRVRLTHPTPYFLELVAFPTFGPIFGPSLDPTIRFDPGTGMIQDDPTYWNDPHRVITNGPYYLRKAEFKRYLLLDQNPSYWNKAAMGNQRILERIIQQPETAVLAYNNGEVDWVPDVPTASPLAAELASQDRDDVHTVAAAGTYFYNFNCLDELPDGTPNPLADPRVRRAMSMTIDRQAIVSVVTKLNQPIARTFVPVGAVKGYDPPAEHGIGFDPTEAQALLAEAGYPGGQGLDGLSILYNTGAGHEVIAQAIKAGWERHLGVTVSLEGLEVTSFGDRLKNHQYTIARASWFGDYQDPTTWLEKMRTGGANNDCAYSNPDYDALLDRAARATDPGQRMDLLRQAEAVLLEDSPMAMIYQYIHLHLFDPQRVTGLKLNSWNRLRLEQIRVADPDAPAAQDGRAEAEPVGAAP